jgi:glycosyltransferase involved in cell wall biosynthesis
MRVEKSGEERRRGNLKVLRLDAMSQQQITISVFGKYHAYSLATEYARLGLLKSLYSIHRSLKAPGGIPKQSFHNRIDLAGLRLMQARIPSMNRLGLDVDDIFDRWVTKRLVKSKPGILHGWNGGVRRTFSKLKGSDWLLCLERSCPHNMYQYELLMEEASNLGLRHWEDKDKLKRNIEELYLADIIIAPSQYSARSYEDPELQRKVRINALGANFEYRDRDVGKRGLKILLVGNAFLRKGTHYLIEAFKLIDDPTAELWLRGSVPDEYRKRITDARVKIIPPLLPRGIMRLYESATVFVQPSIDEGFGMTVLEALAFGLPVIATEHVGATDILDEEVAQIVPIRDPEAIAKAIRVASTFNGPRFDQRRRALLERYTWASCAESMLNNVYRA